MAISREQKEEILKKLTEKFKDAKSIVFAENKGLTVEEITDYRAKLREKGAEYGLAKKTLFKKALAENGIEEIGDSVMKGPIGAVFGFEDELSSIQVTHKYTKDNEKLVIHGGVFEGKPVDAEYIIALASVPSREELLAKLLGSINSPISGFVGTTNGVVSGFVRALSEISKQKEQTA